MIDSNRICKLGHGIWRLIYSFYFTSTKTGVK